MWRRTRFWSAVGRWNWNRGSRLDPVHAAELMDSQVSLLAGLHRGARSDMAIHRRRRLAAFRKNAQTLPTTNTGSYPSNYQQPETGSSYYTSQYQPPAGAPPLSKPPQAYQPSSANQYGGNGGDREHDYEYQQAEENRRMEEQDSGALPPPAYDAVAGNKVNPNCAYPNHGGCDSS